jgi:hypothetical protein
MVQENIIVSLMHLTELFCLIFHLIVRALGSKAVGLLGGQELPGESIGQVSVILSRQDGVEADSFSAAVRVDSDTLQTSFAKLFST